MNHFRFSPDSRHGSDDQTPVSGTGLAVAAILGTVAGIVVMVAICYFKQFP